MKALKVVIWSLGLLALGCAPTETNGGGTAGTGKDFKGPIGLQLYSLREQFKKDVPGTLNEVKQFGFKYVELAGTYGQTPEQFRDELKKRGLEAVRATFADVVTADRFVTDLSDQDALNRVWGEYFRDAKPATTTVQVVRLATDPRCLVEINAVAVID